MKNEKIFIKFYQNSIEKDSQKRQNGTIQFQKSIERKQLINLVHHPSTERRQLKGKYANRCQICKINGRKINNLG